MEKFQSREWRRGEIYSPHDLSPAEMKKWRRRHSPPTDAFDSLNKNPLDLYKVCSISFVHAMTAMSGGVRTSRWKWFTNRTVSAILTELLNYVRIHNPHGTHQAPKYYRITTSQPAQDRKGYPQIHRTWAHAQCSQTPGDPSSRGEGEDGWKHRLKRRKRAGRQICLGSLHVVAEKGPEGTIG